MCGIVGLLARRHNGFFGVHGELFSNLLRIDSIRGADSTGVFGVTQKGGIIDIIKGDADGYVFTSSKNYETFKRRIPQSYHLVVGHNRAATKGSVSAQNAHPFQEGHIVLVHNGTIFNQDDLNKEAEVDSHAICHALNEHDATTALGKINGAFALVWYDSESKTLNLARNKDRPLFLVKYDDFWAFGSEIGLIIWLNRREARKEIEIIDLSPGKIYQLGLENLGEIAPKIIEYDEYKYVPPPTPPVSFLPRWQNEVNRIFERPEVVQGQTSGFKVGDVIRVSFHDDKEDENHGSTLFLGHPVIDGAIHNDILIRYPLMNNSPYIKEFEKLVCSYEYFTANVRAYSIYQGVPIYIVDDVIPVTTIKSFNNTYITETEATKIISLGCQRCKGIVKREDLSKTVVKIRKDNTYRIICPKCISESLSRIQPKVPQQPSVH